MRQRTTTLTEAHGLGGELVVTATRTDITLTYTKAGQTQTVTVPKKKFAAACEAISPQSAEAYVPTSVGSLAIIWQQMTEPLSVALVFPGRPQLLGAFEFEELLQAAGIRLR